MMKLAIVLFILSSIPTIGQTSLYHPFPDSNAVWGYSKHDINGVSGIWKIILTNSDTIINSIGYRKVISPTAYLGGLRQDTALKIVYFIPKDSLTEEFLYDFNLQVTDTVPLSYIGCYPDVYISSLDSTNQFGNGFRKIFNLSGAIWAPYSLIEGIGTSGGIFVPYCENDGYYYQLDCFSINDSIIFWNGASWVDCNMSTNITNNYTNKSPSNIFPNPFHSSATLELNNDFINSELTIYNTFGQIVKYQKIISLSTILNCEILSKDIYFYRLINNRSQMVSGKFMIE